MPVPTTCCPREELRGAIDLHHKEGGVRKPTGHVGILDLGDTHVDEVMVHRKSMLMIDADLTPAEIIKQALDSPYTRIPLWSGEQENIIGVLRKDLLRALAASNGSDETLDIRRLATAP